MVRDRTSLAWPLLILGTGLPVCAQQQLRAAQGVVRLLQDSFCSSTLEFRGAETVAQREMGRYQLTNLSTEGNAGRPIYCFANDSQVDVARGPFLFFHPDFGQWRIGYDYRQPDASVSGPRVPDPPYCPEATTRWYDFRDGQWQLAQLDVTTSGEAVSVASVEKGPGILMPLVVAALACILLVLALVLCLWKKRVPPQESADEGPRFRMSTLPAKVEGDF